MVNLTWFESEKDLQELTGLDHDGLWDAGFDLDDWDFGFVTDEKLRLDVYDYGDYNCGYYYLIKPLVMNNFAFEPTCTEYNGRYYYMCYHA